MHTMRTLLLLSLFAAIGCMTPTIMVTKQYQDSSFIAGAIQKTSKIKLFIPVKVNKKNLNKMFGKEYSTDEGFKNTLAQQIADSLKTTIGCSCDISGAATEGADLLAINYNPANIEKTRELFATQAFDYFFVIKMIYLTLEERYSIETGSTQRYIATLSFDIWNVKDKKKVLSFEAKGSLFNNIKYGVEDAVHNMTAYLATGKTSFY
jgi:hypothetical protein